MVTGKIMNQNTLKQVAAVAALEYVLPHFVDKMVVGVGTGSTVNFFIQELAKHKHLFDGCVSSSEQSTRLLKEHGIPVYPLNTVNEVLFYIDGADEVNKHLQLIKGGGGALTREKIVAAVAKKFICIADKSKMVDVLGKFPVPVEVVPMARSYVARELVKIGGDPRLRVGVITDEGNEILDVLGLELVDPIEVERRINQITGVVMNGIFAVQPADELFLSSQDGIQKITLPSS